MIIVTLHRSMLEAKNACPKGLALYDSIKEMQDQERRRIGREPRLYMRLRWSRLAQLLLATSHSWAWNWMRDQGLLPSLNLGGANLAGADLGGANLGGANLVRADLAGADLDGANLARANLGGANLDGANLARAYLGGADLGGADLAGADLGGWERSPNGYARRKAP